MTSIHYESIRCILFVFIRSVWLSLYWCVCVWGGDHGACVHNLNLLLSMGLTPNPNPKPKPNPNPDANPNPRFYYFCWLVVVGEVQARALGERGAGGDPALHRLPKRLPGVGEIPRAQQPTLVGVYGRPGHRHLHPQHQTHHHHPQTTQHHRQALPRANKCQKRQNASRSSGVVL